MDENEIMNNDSIVDGVAEVAVNSSKNLIVGAAAGASALVILGVGALIWNKWGKYKLAEAKEAREREAREKYEASVVIVEDDSTDSGTAE